MHEKLQQIYQSMAHLYVYCTQFTVHVYRIDTEVYHFLPNYVSRVYSYFNIFYYVF
jgi:hypothetical protein